MQRVIRQSPAFSKFLDSAIATDQRVDDVWRALEWRISRDPECGLLLVDHGLPTDVRIARIGSRDSTWPGMVVLYRYKPPFPVVEIISGRLAD